MPRTSVTQTSRLDAGTLPPGDPGASGAEGVLEVEVLARERPLPGAEVRLYARDRRDPSLGEAVWRLVGQGLTEAPGRVRLASGPGTYLVAVHADGHAPHHRHAIRPHGEARTPVRIALEPGHALEGRTVVEETKEPLPLVQLVLTAAGHRQAWGEPIELPAEERVYAASDERGRFRVDGLAAGDYLLEARTPGHARARLEPVRLPAKEPLEVVLRPAAVIEGFVVDSRGEPAVGAEVQVSGQVPQSVTTGAGGGFSVEVEAGTYGVSARHAGETGALAQSLTLSAGRTLRGVRIQLGPEAVLKGRVFNLFTKDPVVGARVEVSPHQANGDAGRATTDETGHFRVGALAPGSYDVVASAPGFSPTLRQALTVTARDDFSVELALAGTGTLEGWVRDAAGRPIGGAWVIAPNDNLSAVESLPSVARTDAEGHYRLEGIQAGHPFITARRDGATQGIRKLTNVDEGVTVQLDFTLEGTGIVEGRVRAASGVSPTEPLLVLAVRKERNEHELAELPRVPVKPGDDFRMVLPAGTYEFWLTPYPFPPPTPPQAALEVEEGRTTRVELLWDEEPAPILLEGLVVEADGTPSPGAELTFLAEGRSGQEPIQFGRADDKGHFVWKRTHWVEREALTATLKVNAINRGRSGQVSGVKLGERKVLVRLRPSASLQGRVLRAGEPVRGFTLELDHEREEDWSYPNTGPREFAGDRFELHDVLPEPLRVKVETKEGARVQALVTPQPGKSTQVELVIQGSASVLGRVVNTATGEPVADFTVFVENAPSVHEWHLGGGRFLLESMKPGENVITLVIKDAGTDTRLKRTVNLTEGEMLELGDLFVNGPLPSGPP